MKKTPTVIIGKREKFTLRFIDDGCAVHFLKTESKHFDDVRRGKKKAEFRKNDRDFRVNDVLILVEIDAKQKQTGKFVIVRIDHVLYDFEHRDIPEGYAMLSIKVLYPDAVIARLQGVE